MYLPNYNSYFVHVPKCAGTSVTLFFFEMHGIKIRNPRRIFEQLGRPLGSKFHYGNHVPGLRYETQHLSAFHCIHHGLKEFTEAKYTFAFVRNPWHRFVSETIWKQEVLFPDHTIDKQLLMHQREARGGVDRIVPHNTPMWKMLYDNDGKLLVDDVFKVEDMKKAEKKLSEVFKTKVEFGRHNTTVREDYDYYLTPNVRRQLLPAIEKDLELFNYE
jgi:hypothetical protein